ncbi:MAG: hypothetical protein WDZ28_02710 [Simkaniaceae bacterium]
MDYTQVSSQYKLKFSDEFDSKFNLNCIELLQAINEKSIEITTQFPGEAVLPPRLSFTEKLLFYTLISMAALLIVASFTATLTATLFFIISFPTLFLPPFLLIITIMMIPLIPAFVSLAALGIAFGMGHFDDDEMKLKILEKLTDKITSGCPFQEIQNEVDQYGKDAHKKYRLFETVSVSAFFEILVEEKKAYTDAVNTLMIKLLKEEKEGRNVGESKHINQVIRNTAGELLSEFDLEISNYFKDHVTLYD